MLDFVIIHRFLVLLESKEIEPLIRVLNFRTRCSYKIVDEFPWQFLDKKNCFTFHIKVKFSVNPHFKRGIVMWALQNEKKNNYTNFENLTNGRIIEEFKSQISLTFSLKILKFPDKFRNLGYFHGVLGWGRGGNSLGADLI